MNHRIERVRELLKRNLGELIERAYRFEGALVTVSEADITPDLKQAHIYISVLGEDHETVLAQLRHHRKELQYQLGRRVILKHTPRLHFHADASAERGVRIVRLLEEMPSPSDDESHDPSQPHP